MRQQRTRKFYDQDESDFSAWMRENGEAWIAWGSVALIGLFLAWHAYRVDSMVSHYVGCK